MPPLYPSPAAKAIIIGISGFTSSGKTTLARLLADILPGGASIIHGDDYYKPESELPKRAGFVDWDSTSSLNVTLLTSHLKHVLTTGHLPEILPEATELSGQHPPSIPHSLLDQLRSHLLAKLPPKLPPIFILEGFLLFSASIPVIPSLLAPKMMLLADYEKAKERRRRREGYIVAGGSFWADPPGYVDQVVWPGFKDGYGWMFDDLNENVINEKRVNEADLRVMPRKLLKDDGLKGILEWAVGVIETDLSSKIPPR